MRLDELPRFLASRLKTKVDYKQPGWRRWTFLGDMTSYVDPAVITLDSYFSIQEHFRKNPGIITETGIIRGPESSTKKPYYRVKGFYIVPWNDTDSQKADVYTASKLRNPRFEILERNVL